MTTGRSDKLCLYNKAQSCIQDSIFNETFVDKFRFPVKQNIKSIFALLNSADSSEDSFRNIFCFLVEKYPEQFSDYGDHVFAYLWNELEASLLGGQFEVKFDVLERVVSLPMSAEMVSL